MITVGQNPIIQEKRINGLSTSSKRSSFGGITFAQNGVGGGVNVLEKKSKTKEAEDVSHKKFEDEIPPYLKVQKEKREIREKHLSKFPEMRLERWSNLLHENSQDATDWTSIPNIIDEEERQIIQCTSATKLAKSIAKGKYTSVQVTKAFIKAAVLAQDVTNCLTEICFDEALERAGELDEYWKKTGGKTVGPLHGLPISVKDHIDVQGLDSSSGLAAWCFKKIARKDAIIVECLRKAGAIVYCKTSNPQTLLAIETNNNVYGRTLNPHNTNHSAGGSTGGEGALIAMHGSLMGIGTDIAGSIRVPALWNGCYGLKPSIGRLPHTGLQGPHEGMDTLLGVCGPLTKHLEDLTLFCSVILDQEPWNMEAQTMAIPWKSLPLPLPEERLTIAVMYDDGLCAIHPPIKAALMQTVDRLRMQGHRIVEWNPILAQESDTLLMEMLLQDQGREYWQLLEESKEPAVPLIEWLLKERIPSKEVVKKPEDAFSMVRIREKIRQSMIERWNEIGADVILCPGAPTLAARHDQSRHWGYTSIWNIVDWPAVIFPVEKPSEKVVEEIQWPPTNKPRNFIESQVINEWNPSSDPERYKNLPLGLQLVGRRLQEERLLYNLAIVERDLQKSD